MDTDLITINECRNDGKTIYAYYQPISGAWFTYGISAYLLKQLCDRHNIQALETYSKEMQMPCVFIIDIVDIMSISTHKHISDNHSIINVESQVDEKDYRIWAQDLRKK